MSNQLVAERLFGWRGTISYCAVRINAIVAVAAVVVVGLFELCSL